MLADPALLECLRAAEAGHALSFLARLGVSRADHLDTVSNRQLQEAGLSLGQIDRIRAVHAMARQAVVSGAHMHPQAGNENAGPQQAKTVIDFQSIKLLEKMGEGTFAVVKRAYWTQPTGTKLDVAVKILRDASPQVMEDLRQEASQLLRLQHPHLIRLYGVVEQPAMMVFELCEGGSLLERLRDQQKLKPLVTQLLEYTVQIATGMAYLESRHCVHRDLATRNILLTRDERSIKICDFGLMRSLEENERQYVMSAQKKVPFAWCPPEALRHRVFSHASDVWAMGVTMWEIFTYGEEPWIGCRGIDVLKRVDAGERLERPSHSSHQLYELMQLCWKITPDQRPRFALLKNFLKQNSFNCGEVRESVPPSSTNTLSLLKGDRVIVIESSGVLWEGQSERTRQFGSFPRSAVFVGGGSVVGGGGGGGGQKSAREANTSVQMIATAPLSNTASNRHTGGSSRISLPVNGSLIHTGHGDVRGGASWGTPEKIDDVYLKNPVMSGRPLSPVSLAAPKKPDELLRIKPQLPSKPPTLRPADAFEAGLSGQISPLGELMPPIPSTSAPSSRIDTMRPSAELADLNQWSRPMPSPSSHRVAPPPPQTQPMTGQQNQHVQFRQPFQQQQQQQQQQVRPHSVQPAYTPQQMSQIQQQLAKVLECQREKTLSVLQPTAMLDTSSVRHSQPVQTTRAQAQVTAELQSVLDSHQQRGGGGGGERDVLGRGVTRPPPQLQSVPRPNRQSPETTQGARKSSAPPPIRASDFRVENSAQTQQPPATPTQPVQPVVAQPHKVSLPAMPSTASVPAPQPARLSPPTTAQSAQSVPLRAETLPKQARPVSVQPVQLRASGSTPDTTRLSTLPTVASRPASSVDVSALLPPPSALFYGGGNVPREQPAQALPASHPASTQQTAPHPQPQPQSQAPPAATTPRYYPVLTPTPLHGGRSDSPATTLAVMRPSTASPQQVPIFDLRRNEAVQQPNPLQRPLVLTPLPDLLPSDRQIDGDILSQFDPLTATRRPAAVAAVSDASRVTLAEQMETLYKDAFFTDRARCDRMVNQCGGDVSKALHNLKVDYLISTGLTLSRDRADAALIAEGGSLNAAADQLMSA